MLDLYSVVYDYPGIMPGMPTLDSLRHQAQLAFIASGQDIELGHSGLCPRTPAQLATLEPGGDGVLATLSSGLTAWVHHLQQGGVGYAIKKARPQCLVQNRDGQTSFLNELQRRRDIAEIQARHGGFAGVVPTLYGSLAHGIIVSPWIEGGTVQQWDERKLLQLFDSGAELVRHGLFEWDYCPGNLLDDGRQLWLFDFGYMYRFDPLRQFNSAGMGNDVPQHHLAERFETRNYFAWLLQLEQTQGQDATLAAFRLEKEIALECYLRLRADLNAAGATLDVRDWLDSIIKHWRQALKGELEALYWQEGWRSHRLDLDDDLRGQTCTPLTLARCDWLLDAVTQHHDTLRACGALADETIAPDRRTLLAHYRQLREQAEGFQLTT